MSLIETAKAYIVKRVSEVGADDDIAVVPQVFSSDDVKQELYWVLDVLEGKRG